MLKKIIMGLLLVSSLFGVDLIKKEAKQTEDKKAKFFSGPKSLFSFRFADKFFKYSTAYASFSLNAPRYKDDRFAIVGGLSTGDLVVERTEGELKPDFQTSFGLRKIGRFQYEPKRGVKSAGKGGGWYDGQTEQNANESATFGPVKGWEYLIKWSEGRQWGNEYVNQEYWLRYIGNWVMLKVGMTELGLEDIAYGQADLRVHLTPEALGNKLHFSVGVKHRQHPVYGFDAMVLDTTWYKGSWWAFAEDAFGIDDNEWRDPLHFDEDGNWIGSELIEYINGLKIHELTEFIFSLIRSINKYLEQKEPWKTYKDFPGEGEVTSTTLYISLECIRICSQLLNPIMPNKTSLVLDAINCKKTDFNFGQIEVGEKISLFPTLFPRIEVK